MTFTRVLVFVRTINYSLLLPFLSSSAYGMGTHALTSRPIGEIIVAIGEPSAAPAFSITSIGEITAEPSAAPDFPITGVVEITGEITVVIIDEPFEPSAARTYSSTAVQSKGLSNAKNSFSDGTISNCFISLVIVLDFIVACRLVCMDRKSW